MQGLDTFIYEHKKSSMKPPVGSRLKFFFQTWMDFTSDIQGEAGSHENAYFPKYL